MFNISISTGQRIAKVAFVVGFVLGGLHVIPETYNAFGLVLPFLWGAISAFLTAGVLALLKRY